MAETFTCVGCGQSISSDDAFCSTCGTPVPSSAAGAPTPDQAPATSSGCSNCGHPLESGARFCAGCGTPVASDGPRSTWDAVAERLAAATSPKYQILGLLGKGAMGAVYLARQGRLKRKVAIKVIAPSLLADESMVERFRFEAETLAALRHPHITQIFEVSETPDLHYFVMEYVDGPSLRQVTRARKSLPISAVQSILYQVGTALGHVHSRHLGLVHRDVKPGNIMLDQEGNAFITDFGISKAAQSQAGLTMTGMVIGTPEYMSPEQWKGQDLTGASDQYALGMVGYELVCGGAPFTGEPYAVMSQHLYKEPAAIHELRPDCPPEMATALLRMIAKEPQDRFDDLDAAVVALGGKALGRTDPVRDELVNLVREVQEDGGTSPSTGGQDTARRPAAVELGGVPEHVAPGDTFQLSARVLDDASEEVSEPGVRWTSTDPSVAVVHEGSVRILGTGEVSIVARVGELETTVPIRVDEPRTAEILIMPRTVRLEAGERVELGAELRDGRGRPLDGAPSWQSRDEAVATVSTTGEVQARRPGTATVTAEHQGVQAAASITVEPPHVHAIRLSDPPTGLRVGASVTLEAECLNRHGQPVQRTVAWSTADPGVATVEDHTLSALAPGATAVTALADTATQTFVVEVRPGPVATVRVTAPDGILLPGDERSLALRAEDVDGNPVEDASPEWRSTDASVLQVADGHVTAAGTGTAEIEVVVEGVVERLALTVEAPVPSALSLVPSTLPELEVGESGSLAARVTDQRDRPLDVAVDWGSGSVEVLTVAGGTVRGVAPGDTVVTASAGGLEATVTVRVVPAAVRDIRLQLADAQLLTGAASAIEAVALDARGARLSDRPVSLRSSDTSVATVDPEGTVTAVGKGRVRLLAECEGREAACELEVLSAPVSRVSVSNPPPDLQARTRFQLQATPLDAQGAPVDDTVSWRSSDPAVARVTGHGAVRTRKAGLAEIVASCQGVEERVSLRIAAAPVPAWRRPAALAGGAAAILATVALGLSMLGPGSNSTLPTTGQPEGQSPGVASGQTPDLPSPPVDGGDGAGAGGAAPSGNENETALGPPTGQPAETAGEASVSEGGADRPDSTAPVAAEIWTPRSALELRVGQRLPLQAEARTADGSPVALPISWTSADPSVATVDAGSGAASLVGNTVGTTSVRASAGGMVSRVAVTVVPEAVAQVAVTPGTLSLQPGQARTLQVVLLGESGDTLQQDVAWSTGDASVASVDGAGLVTARAPGTVEITARSGSHQAGARLSVTAPVATLSGLEATTELDGARETLVTRLSFAPLDAGGAPLCAVTSLAPADVGSAFEARQDVAAADAGAGTAQILTSLGDLALSPEDLRALPRGGYRGENRIDVEVRILAGTCSSAPASAPPVGVTQARACIMNLGQGDWLPCR